MNHVDLGGDIESSVGYVKVTDDQDQEGHDGMLE